MHIYDLCVDIFVGLPHQRSRASIRSQWRGRAVGRHTQAARAIKIIMKDKVPNEDRSRRLQREIQTLFALDHPTLKVVERELFWMVEEVERYVSSIYQLYIYIVYV